MIQFLEKKDNTPWACKLYSSISIRVRMMFKTHLPHINIQGCLKGCWCVESILQIDCTVRANEDWLFRFRFPHFYLQSCCFILWYQSFEIWKYVWSRRINAANVCVFHREGKCVAQLVEHGANNAMLRGSISRECIKCVAWMHCRLLWMNVSAKFINEMLCKVTQRH